MLSSGVDKPTQESGQIRQILFDSSSQRSIHLLELNDSTLQKSITSGDMITFKGQGGEDLILCTASQTFLIQQLTISNTQLLCGYEEGGWSDGNLLVLSKSSYRLEPKLLVRPNFKPLEEKLEATMYDNPDLIPQELLLPCQFVHGTCQASDTEIDRFLVKFGTIEIDGILISKFNILRIH